MLFTLWMLATSLSSLSLLSTEAFKICVVVIFGQFLNCSVRKLLCGSWFLLEAWLHSWTSWSTSQNVAEPFCIAAKERRKAEIQSRHNARSIASAIVWYAVSWFGNNGCWTGKAQSPSTVSSSQATLYSLCWVCHFFPLCILVILHYSQNHSQNHLTTTNFMWTNVFVCFDYSCYYLIGYIFIYNYHNHKVISNILLCWPKISSKLVLHLLVCLCQHSSLVEVRDRVSFVHYSRSAHALPVAFCIVSCSRHCSVYRGISQFSDCGF